MTVPITYRAMQVAAGGTLELVERRTPSPGPDQVLIRVEACGVCGADAADIGRADPGLQPPRVPGHEVVGRIAALGANVPSLWTIGQRVGVGRLGGHCNQCEQCRQGRFELCRNQPVVGASIDGGYAEMMLARSTGLVAIPDELDAIEAAPVLCAGIATFNALKKSGAQAGDLVAVLGIGGLGHMAVQYARRMGFRVAAIGRGQDIAQDALDLGAHVYIDGNEVDAVEALNGMGGANAIIATTNDASVVSAIATGLAPGGRMIILGVGKDPLSLAAGFLVSGERAIAGSITGSPLDNERALRFSVLTDARPWVETLPFERANDACQRMKSGAARFRIVLTMGSKS